VNKYWEGKKEVDRPLKCDMIFTSRVRERGPRAEKGTNNPQIALDTKTKEKEKRGTSSPGGSAQPFRSDIRPEESEQTELKADDRGKVKQGKMATRLLGQATGSESSVAKEPKGS